MQRRNDLCALANSRRNPLDGFRADISNGEDAPPVGFQRMAIVAGIFAGQHKPLSIECDGSGETLVAIAKKRLLLFCRSSSAHRRGRDNCGEATASSTD